MATFSPVDLQQALSGVGYPADGEQLVERARENGASKELTQELEQHKEERFDGPAEVSKAIFGEQ